MLHSSGWIFFFSQHLLCLTLGSVHEYEKREDNAHLMDNVHFLEVITEVTNTLYSSFIPQLLMTDTKEEQLVYHFIIFII